MQILGISLADKICIFVFNQEKTNILENLKQSHKFDVTKFGGVGPGAAIAGAKQKLEEKFDKDYDEED